MSVKVMFDIPENICKILLPNPRLNVIDLTSFPTPPHDTPLNLLALPDAELFSNIATRITGPDDVPFLQSLGMPFRWDIPQLQERVLNLGVKGQQSLRYPLGKTSQHIQLPFWVLEFWDKAHKVAHAKHHWHSATLWLKEHKRQNMLSLLTGLPWNHQLPRHFGGDVIDLAQFCSQNWLHSPNLDMMMALLNQNLLDHGISVATVVDTMFGQKLIDIHRRSKETYLDDKTAQFIRNMGARLKERSVEKVGMVICVRLCDDGTVALPKGSDLAGNHWVGVVIDAALGVIHYGDALGKPPPAELLSILEWWLVVEVPRFMPFKLELLPCTAQKDSFSCSILAANAITHHLLPQVSLLISAGKSVILTHIEILKALLFLLQKLVCSIQILTKVLSLTIQDPILSATAIHEHHQSSLASASTFNPTSSVVFGSPVRSGLLTSRAFNRNRNRSIYFSGFPKRPDRTDVDRSTSVFCG